MKSDETITTRGKHCSAGSAAKWQRSFLSVVSTCPNAGEPVTAKSRSINLPESFHERTEIGLLNPLALYGSKWVAPISCTVADEHHPPWNETQLLDAGGL